MFSQWVFLSVLALAVPSFAWAEDAVSDLAKEQSKAEQGDKRGDELFAEFTRPPGRRDGEPQALFDFGAYFYQQQNYASAREWWGKAAAAGMVRAQINWPCSIAMVTAGHRTRPRRHAGSGRPRSRGCRRPE